MCSHLSVRYGVIEMAAVIIINITELLTSIPPFPPFSPSLISIVVSVDVKHHVYFPTRKGRIKDRPSVTAITIHVLEVFNVQCSAPPVRSNLCTSLIAVLTPVRSKVTKTVSEKATVEEQLHSKTIN